MPTTHPSPTASVRCHSCLKPVTPLDADGLCVECTVVIRDELRHRALRAASHLMHEFDRLKRVAQEYGATADEIARLVAYRDCDFEITVEGI